MRRGKVVVVGRGEAGKSTLIQALCDRPMNLEVNGRTVAMDHGTIACERGIVHLVGVPGQGRSAPVREALAARAIGAIWVHPAGEPPDTDTTALLSSLADTLPYLVFVNHRSGLPEEGFPSPSELPLPTAIVRGDLSRPGETLPALELEIWKLLERAGTGPPPL